MKKSLLLSALAAVALSVAHRPTTQNLANLAGQATGVPPPDVETELTEDLVRAAVAALDSHAKRRATPTPVALAWKTIRRVLGVPVPLTATGAKGDEWYHDCDGHYIDVKRDTQGRYSVFFRNRTDKTEAWHDQADQPRTILEDLIEAAPRYEAYAAGRGYAYVCAFCGQPDAHSEDCLLTRAKRWIASQETKIGI